MAAARHLGDVEDDRDERLRRLVALSAEVEPANRHMELDPAALAGDEVERSEIEGLGGLGHRPR